jgi:hypothetical protein
VVRPPYHQGGVEVAKQSLITPVSKKASCYTSYTLNRISIGNMEPVIKGQVDSSVRKEHLELIEIALDLESMKKDLNRVRKDD